MGQVPVFSSYLVIGDGRAARHIRHYFDLEAIPFKSWHRRNPRDDLRSLAAGASHVLLLISDSAIAAFLRDHEFLEPLVRVHFSGALSINGAIGAHPLMTFASDKLYDLESYRKIPFVVESGHELEDVLPRLQNPAFQLAPENKGLYHALCVLSGNFTVLLWEKAFREFAGKLGLPKEALLPYLRQTMENLATAGVGESVLTGPLARGDHKTIEKNLASLKDDPYRAVYEAMSRAHALDRKGTT